MRSPPARVLLAGIVAASVAAVLVSCSSGSSARPPVERFLGAWSKGDAAAAAALTDNPAAAQAALQGWRSSLDIGAAKLALKSASDTKATFAADVDLNGLGRWRYAGSLAIRKVNGKVTVAWSPSVLYPGLAAGQDLRRTRTLPPRAAILDRNSSPLLTPTPVVTVGAVKKTHTRCCEITRQNAPGSGVPTGLPSYRTVVFPLSRGP